MQLTFLVKIHGLQEQSVTFVMISVSVGRSYQQFLVRFWPLRVALPWSWCQGLLSSGSFSLQSAASVAAVPGFSGPEARGVIPDQGLNPRPLSWQVGSSPLDHQGSPYSQSEC